MKTLGNPLATVRDNLCRPKQLGLISSLGHGRGAVWFLTRASEPVTKRPISWDKRVKLRARKVLLQTDFIVALSSALGRKAFLSVPDCMPFQSALYGERSAGFSF